MIRPPLCRMVAVAAGVLGVVGAFGTAVVQGGTIVDYDPVRHDRFLSAGDGTPDPARPNSGFFLNDRDLSGVAVGGRGAVLLTPRHYLTATHFRTLSPTFRGIDGTLVSPGRDTSFGSGGFYTPTTTYTDEDGNTVTAGSDLSIGRLAQPLDEDNFTPLRVFHAEPADVVGQEVLVFDQFRRAGRNVIDATGVGGFNGQFVTALHGYDFDAGGDGGVGGDEIFLQGGDSSHASLVDFGGFLAVLGTHFGVSYLDDDQTMPGSSFSSFISPYIDDINAVTTADGHPLRVVATVPEPGAGLCVAGALLLLRRRRPRRA